MCIYIYIYTQYVLCVCRYTHVYIYIYIHAYINIYIYIYIYHVAYLGEADMQMAMVKGIEQQMETTSSNKQHAYILGYVIV